MKKDDIKTTVVFDEEGYSDDLGDGPVGELTIVKDFLPPPERLVKKEETTKVTLALSPRSLAFFKQKAAALGVPYQRMIRNLIDEYAARHRDE